MTITQSFVGTLLAILLLPAVGIGQVDQTQNAASTQNSTEVDYNVIYEIKPKQNPDPNSAVYLTKKESQIHLVLNLPRTIDRRQVISEITYFPEPVKRYIINDNNYVEYIFPMHKIPAKVKVSVKAKIFRYDLETALERGKRSTIEDTNMADFLCSERMIEANDPAIQAVAKSIGGQTDIETAKLIYQYVIRNLTFDVSKLKGVGAAKTLKSKKGMCIDYCDLFVALSRAKHIPARVVAGYKTEFQMTPKHSWVEVCFKGYGWVPLDPMQWPDISEESLDMEFRYREPQFLTFTHLRSDKMLSNNYYWKCCGDPDYNDIALFESIEFKRPFHLTHNSDEDKERTKAK